MGRDAVIAALQLGTHLNPVAQTLFFRLSYRVRDGDAVWVFRKERAILVEDCNSSERTLQRHFFELEGKDDKGNILPNAKRVVFRGLRPGRRSEYIVLKPSHEPTAAYIEANYGLDDAKLCYPNFYLSDTPDPRQDDATDSRQDGATPPASGWRNNSGHPRQVDTHPRQDGATIKEWNSPLGFSPLKDSTNIQQGNSAEEIWNSTLAKIRGRENRQRCFTWFDPLRPVSFAEGVLTLEVPNQHFRDQLMIWKAKMLECAIAAKCPVREITFVVKRQARAVARSPG